MIMIMGGCEIAREVCQKVDQEENENIFRGAVKEGKEQYALCLL